MGNRIQEAWKDRNGNYILPFFWMHGAEEAVIRELMAKVDECGIKAVCLESRPHPDYVGEQWWHDVDIVLDEAVRRGMKVWILDDSHFPTGLANGAVKDADDRLKRWSLMEKHYDFKGPVSGDKYDITNQLNVDMRTRSADPDKYKEQLVSVLLGKAERKGDRVVYTDLEDVTDQVENGWLFVEAPEGDYRIFVLTKKLHAALMLADGVSNLEKESVRILIDEVYEAHYKRYGDYFGTTIAGFFSDEPGFFNLGDAGYGMPPKLGQGAVPLPWSDGVFELLKERFGARAALLLPALFEDCGFPDAAVSPDADGNGSFLEQAAAIRYAYMDIITKAYAENFTGQLGKWCRDHGVEYIGHIVEDYPMYERLGPSAGHYFRAIKGQAMAGIDVVLRQLLPDEDEGRGEFYHYGLEQLAASLACQDPDKQGRAMCELFGAFGWVEGVTMMKWMADHMLSGGINVFVPHAFTEQEFPDPDCPPHYYARGNNPQYPYLNVLFRYMNRMAHLLTGGKPVVKNAVLFEAESDWVGKSEPFQVIGKLLLTHQIPYHVLCTDFLKEAKVENGLLRVGDMAYERLFVGKAEYMETSCAERLAELGKMGASVYFTDGKPCRYDGTEYECLGAFPCISKAEIPVVAGETSLVRCAEEEKWLRVYPYEQGGSMIYMLFNASGKKEIRTRLTFAGPEPDLRYDVLNQNMTRLVDRKPVDGSPAGQLSVTLAPGESVLLLAGYVPEEKELSGPIAFSGKRAAYGGSYRISLAGYRNPDQFGGAEETDTLYDIARKHPGFAGTVRYELSFRADGYVRLLLSGCREAVRVFLNGELIGTRITAPYVFDFSGKEKEGENELRIELATTLVNAVPDGISCGGAIPPTGLLGPVEFLG